MKYQRNIYFLLIIILLSVILVYSSIDAKITGSCSNCHTMHASQNGNSVGIAYGGSSLPQPTLVRGTCLGCHGQNTSGKIVTIGGCDFPQVLHTDSSGDLAGGNFAYITGAKSRITADQNSAGHNVIDLGVAYNESVLNGPPGGKAYAGHFGHDVMVTKSNLTCAGENGCHGTNRMMTLGSGLPAVKGSHHKNVDGKCNTAPATAVVYNSYRFLCGVNGFENTGPYKWQNYNANNHNEYFGTTSPLSNPGGCSDCHGGTCATYSSNGSISAFCGTCHGNFHTLGGTQYGIGGDTSSPFTRHPTDIILSGTGEYSAYTAYSTEAPVARGAVPDNISSTVTPGDSGTEGAIVMCLSCHGAHATPYADMLKWDYSTMVAGGGGSGGCFTCHTLKNSP